MRSALKSNARGGWLPAATLAGFVLVALAARAGPAQLDPTRVAGRPGGPREARVTAHPPSDQLANGHPAAHHHFQLPWSLIQFVLTGTLLLAVLGLVVVFWPRLPAWLRSRRMPRTVRPVEPAPDDLVGQVWNTLRSTMSQLADGQVRDGVILCWRRLEQTAEAAGLRRSPADTSSDLAERLLASLPVSEAPLNRLAGLYREARFSSHPIPAAAVRQARADLGQLRSELEAGAAGRPAGAGRG
ncbi:MAG: hypothetical protein QOI26_1196 [Pseudonocardiales bacterium]|nr:hypothetical protein [Pseudonocardiales bacterium]